MTAPHTNALLVSAREDLQALEPEWNELLQASTANNIFLTWEWMSTWRKWLGAECELRLWTVRTARERRLMGIAPMARRARRLGGGIPYQELILLGSEPAAADHLDFIVRRGEEPQVGARLRDCLEVTRKECDVVNFEALESQSSTLAPWIAALPRWARQECVSAPYVELPTSWDVYLGGMRQKARADIRRCERLLADVARPQSVVYRRIEHEHELDHGMNELVRMHQAVHVAQDHPGSFANPRVAGFHRELAGHFLRRGWLYLTLLTVEDRPIAALYGFVYGDTFHGFFTGYDREWHRFGPGRQIMAQSIRDAIASGARQYDLLRGNEPYKSVLTDRARELVFVQSAANPLGWLVMGAQAAARGGRPLVKRLRRRTRRLLKREVDNGRSG